MAMQQQRNSRHNFITLSSKYDTGNTHVRHHSDTSTVTMSQIGMQPSPQTNTRATVITAGGYQGQLYGSN